LDGLRVKISTSIFAGTLAALRSRRHAAQLMGLQPDVIFAASTLNLEALQSGVREGVVRLSRCSLGDAAGREDHFEIERGTGLLKRPCREPDFPDETT
jgi:hypothetical protein